MADLPMPDEPRPEPPRPELMEAVTALAKRRGIAFQSSEIYGGLRSSWDYGPLGTELKRNIREQWWRSTCSCGTTSSGSRPP